MTILVQTPTATGTEKMETMSPSFKIYPSSAAFMVGPLVKTSKNNSCHRFLWAQAHCGLTKAELRQEIPAEYQALGALDEYRYSAKMVKEGQTFEREVPFKIEFKSAVISGRQDFVLDNGVVIEKKSMTSDSGYKRVFRDGQVESSHMAQLVSYLAFLNKPEGKIVVSYYELSEKFDAYLVVDEKEFIVRTLDSGVLTVDGVEYPHTVRDLARWYATLVGCLSTTSSVPAKPIIPASPYESPCNFCSLKELCQKNLDAASFLQESKDALRTKRTHGPVKIQVLTERRKKNKEKAKVLPAPADKNINNPAKAEKE